jgi:hypothetical protein
MEDAHAAGCLREGLSPKRLAAMTITTVMFTAQSSGPTNEAAAKPITAEEVWTFCAKGFAAD